MRINFNFKDTLKKLMLLTCFGAGIFLFQAQDFNSDDSDLNPNVDRPPSWVYEMARTNPQLPQMLVVTSSDGYDNYDMGVDFAEGNIAQHPTNLFWAFTVYNINGTHRTTDGGITWAASPPSFPNRAGDPVVAYDSLGNLYYDNMKSPITGTWAAKSTNGGLTWLTPVTANTGNDKNWIAADQTAGPFSNFVYGSMTNGSSASFSRSTNQGASFTLVTNLAPHNLPGTMPCVGPNGNIQGGSVYVVTNSGSFSTPTYTFFRSTNGGASMVMQSSQSGWVNTVGTIVGGRNSVENMRTRPYPFIAADNSFGPFRGRLYCIYAANDPPGSGNKPDIWCRFSTNFGVTFSHPIRINDDVAPQSSNQWHPSIWCDKETGRLYANWMDTRFTPTSDSAEIYASYSSNGGVSWVRNQKLSNRKMKINCASCGGSGTPRYQGDYNGITSNRYNSMSQWSDFRNGNFGSFSSYFPDFAMLINNSSFGIGPTNDSVFRIVKIPSTRLYTDKIKFTATVTPNPGAGAITVSFLNATSNTLQDTLMEYPDSIRVRVKTSGGVPTGSYTVTVKAVGRVGGTDIPPVHVRTMSLNVGFVGVHTIGSEIPERFYLYQNYPNPFNPKTNINVDISSKGMVKLTVYDVTGKVVQILANENMNAGKYTFEFDAKERASGIYFYKIETPEFTGIKKMMLVK